MTGTLNELFVAILRMLLAWEKDLRKLPLDVAVLINRFNAHLLAETKLELKPVRNLRQFIYYFQNYNLGQLGFPLEGYVSLKVIDSDGQVDWLLKEWYEQMKQEDNVDQALVREFLVQCRQEWEKTGNPEIAKMYAAVRSFIQPKNYIIEYGQLVQLRSQYSTLSSLVKNVSNWYDVLRSNREILHVCPICGYVLDGNLFNDFNCRRTCKYYRQRYQLDIETMQLKQSVKYLKLKRGIYLFTLLPGLAETRIYNELCERYGEENVELYPEIDRFDIAVRLPKGMIYIDVKDFAVPYDLAHVLKSENGIYKLNETSENHPVFLVIPDHHKELYINGEYKNIVKKELSTKARFNIVYETQLYREVAKLCNE